MVNLDLKKTALYDAAGVSAEKHMKCMVCLDHYETSTLRRELSFCMPT